MVRLPATLERDFILLFAQTVFYSGLLVLFSYVLLQGGGVHSYCTDIVVRCPKIPISKFVF